MDRVVGVPELTPTRLTGSKFTPAPNTGLSPAKVATGLLRDFLNENDVPYVLIRIDAKDGKKGPPRGFQWAGKGERTNSARSTTRRPTTSVTR